MSDETTEAVDIDSTEETRANTMTDATELTFKSLLEDTFGQVGKDLKAGADELAQYMAERANHLSLHTHEPDFADAVLIERDNIALKAGIIATKEADLADQRILGTIAGALRIAAISLA